MLPLTVLEERIGYTFKNKELLRRAMTHRSFSAEHNERLEFLGDSVLNCVIGNALFLKDKHFDEGSLSRVRSNLVRQSALAEIAERIGICDFLKVGAAKNIPAETIVRQPLPTQLRPFLGRFSPTAALKRRKL